MWSKWETQCKTYYDDQFITSLGIGKYDFCVIGYYTANKWGIVGFIIYSINKDGGGIVQSMSMGMINKSSLIECTLTIFTLPLPCQSVAWIYCKHFSN